MPEATPGRPAPPTRRGLLERLGSFLLGDDIFISYSRADALNYSLALANQLAGRKFLSFVDQYGTSADEKLPPLLKLKVRRSTALVLVGTEGAAASDAVRQEIEEFRLTGRPIIPIDVDGSLARASWAHLLRGLPVSVEGRSGGPAPHAAPPPPAGAAPDFIPETEERRRLGSPAPEVIARIENSFKYTRRNQWLRRMLFAGVAVILLSAGVVGLSANAAVEANLDATLAEVRSQMAAAAADEAAKKVAEAELRLVEARRSVDEANNSSFVAEAMAQLAEGKREAAERLQADAEAKAGLAEGRERAATANAQRQESIASSRRLVGQSASLLGSRPGLSFLLGASAYDAYPTIEARENLLTMWRRYPRLSAVRELHDYPLVGLAASPDGKFVASAAADGSQYLWDAAGRRPLACLSPPMKDLAQSSSYLLLALMRYNKVTFSPDGKLLAAFALNGIQLHDTPSGRKRGLVTYDSTALTVDHHLLTPDGLLILADDSEELYFWDIKDPDNPKPLPPFEFQGRVNSIALDPGGKLLAVALADQSEAGRHAISLFDIASRSLLPGPLVGHQERVSDMAFAPGRGGKLASLDESGNLMLWDVEKRERVGCSRVDLAGNLREHDDRPNLDTMNPANLAFNSAGTAVALSLSGGNIYRWGVEDFINCFDEQAPRRFAAYTPGVSSMAFAGEKVLVTGSSNGILSFWEAGYDHPLERSIEIPLADATSLREVSHDGRVAALAGPSGEMFLWEIESGAPPHQLPSQHTAAVSSLEFSADGQLLAGAGPTKQYGDDMVVTLWDARSRRVLSRRVLYDKTKPRAGATRYSELKEMRFSPGTQKRRLAFVTYDGRVYVWGLDDAAAPSEIFARDVEGASAVAFGRDGRLMAVGTEGGDVHLWDLMKSRPAAEPLPAAGGRVENMAFINEGKTIVAVVSGGNEEVYVVKWDLIRRPARRQSFGLTNFEDMFSSKSSNLVSRASNSHFSPDGTLLALARNNNVGLWDLETLTFLDLHEVAQRGPVGFSFLSFDGSGSRLIMHDNVSVSYRDISPALLLQGACRLAGRPLSGAERALYLQGAREPRTCAEAAGPGQCPPPVPLPGMDEQGEDPADRPGR
jgi:WD40 repeat protein